MADHILKAEVTDVAIGYASVEGLMDENGKFYVALPQISEKFNFSNPQKNLTRDVKALLPEASQTLVKLKTKLHPKAVNALTLKDFEVLVAKLDRSGNLLAQQFRDDLTGLSLHQMFCDAFGIKFDSEDRQDWLKNRMSGMVTRDDLEARVQGYIDRHRTELSDGSARWMYKNVTDAIYKAIFDRTKKKLAEDLKAEDPKKFRDSLNAKELKEVERMEETVMRLIEDCDTHPLEAVVEAAKRTLVRKSDRVVKAA